MLRCSHHGCSWQAIAPSEDAAWDQYAEHLVAEHSETVDVDVPDGMVQVRFRDDDWITVTFDEARRLHKNVHEE